MVGHNPQFTYRKDGVFYFSRRIPKDIRHKYEHDRFVMCLRTKSRVVADKSSRAIAARLDEYWMSLRIADLNIPSMLPMNGRVTTGTVITRQQALQNYHSLKGTGKDDLSCDSAFAQTFIPDRNNVTKRLPIPVEHLRLIQDTCRKTDDDLRSRSRRQPTGRATACDPGSRFKDTPQSCYDCQMA